MVRRALDLAALTVAERLELIQALCDSLRLQPATVPLTPAKRALMAERRAEHAADPGAAVPWQAVRAELWAEQERDEAAERVSGERGE